MSKSNGELITAIIISLFLLITGGFKLLFDVLLCIAPFLLLVFLIWKGLIT